MKKVVLALTVVFIIGISSCKKEESVTPKLSKEAGKVSTKETQSWD